MMGYKSGYNLAGDSSRNIIIGPNAGPPDDSGTNTHHNKLYISITEVSEKLKINKHVIRYWDSKLSSWKYE